MRITNTRETRLPYIVKSSFTLFDSKERIEMDNDLQEKAIAIDAEKFGISLLVLTIVLMCAALGAIMAG